MITLIIRSLIFSLLAILGINIRLKLRQLAQGFAKWIKKKMKILMILKSVSISMKRQ